jgi:hypothetical protein
MFSCLPDGTRLMEIDAVNQLGRVFYIPQHDIGIEAGR